MTVRKAVIPAAGLGTRFLPATKSQPKEMIPVVDKPGIQYVVEEAVRAGLDDVLIVTSRGKITVEDHFDRSLELEHHLQDVGKLEELEEVRRVADLADVHFVRQKEPLGFGHAVSVARHHVAGQSFVVMVGDEIVPERRGEEPLLVERMIELYEERGASVIAVMDVPREDISAYGVVAGEEVGPDLVRVRDMVEKPAPEDAPSTLGSRGRYVFTPDIFGALDRTKEGVGGEIQLTDAIKILAQEREVYAYVHHGPMFDVGKKLEYLQASIELTLRRDDLAKPFTDYLLELAARLGGPGS
jgi:UTP--glucose-1-phosphate uridylyltransferase